MRTKKKAEIEVTEHKCDFCDYSSTSNYRYAGGLAHIESCVVCKKDVCKEHRFVFWDKFFFKDGYEQYGDLITCLQCKSIVEKIWEEEKEKDSNAEYEGRLVDIVQKRLKGKINEN